MPAKHFETMISENFADGAPLLRKVLGMYEGNDWSIDLWHLQPTGKYKLCTKLCRPGLRQWRYDPSARPDDDTF